MSSHYGTPPRSPRNEGAAVDVSMRLMSILMLTPPRLPRSTSAAGAGQDAEIVFVGDNNNDELHDEESLSSFELSEANECCICLQEMVAIDIATIDGCNHQFCTSCVMHWSETNSKSLIVLIVLLFCSNTTLTIQISQTRVHSAVLASDHMNRQREW